MLTAEIVRRVRQIQVRTGRQVADVLAGEYVSVFKGRGMEFDEVRPYVPGDDVRTIDWNVTARSGAPFVKRFVEERQLTVMLLVDVSRSQDFGSAERSKREAAAELSALIAFSAIQNDDKVGLLLFHGETETFIPPRKGQRHALRVIREVIARGAGEGGSTGSEARAEPAASPLRRRFGLGLGRASRRDPRRATNVGAALEHCRRMLPRRAVIFLVSDLIDDGWQKPLRHANRRHDVVCVLVEDARERASAPAGLLTLEDAETGRTEVVDTGSAAFREAADRAAAARVTGVEADLRSAGVDLVRIDAAGDVVDPLIAFFRMRQRRYRA